MSSPDFDARHLCQLDCLGPFAAIDEASLRSPIAYASSGKLVGYTDGDWPTQLRWNAGACGPHPVRPRFRLHDALPLECARADAAADKKLRGRLSLALLGACAAHAAANVRDLAFAHVGDGEGYDGGGGGGIVGHWCHAQHLEIGDPARYRRWLAAVLQMAQRQLMPAWPPGRELATHFWQMWRAQRNGQIGGYYCDRELVRAADELLAVPLREHQVPLYLPAAVYGLWQYCAPTAESDSLRIQDWLLRGAADFAQADETWPLILSAIAYWISGEKLFLTGQLPRLAAWPDRCYREPGTLIHWYWPTGREGCQIAGQWPIFKRALVDAGIDALPLSPAGGLPISQRAYNSATLVAAAGGKFTSGVIRWTSFGGDAYPGRVIAGAATIGVPRPAGRWWFESRLEDALGGVEPTSIKLAPESWGQVSLTTPTRFYCPLTKGEPYYVGNCRGTLEVDGAVTFEVRSGSDEPENWWLNLLFGDWPPLGLWAGKAQRQKRFVRQAATVELAGHDYGRCWITCQEGDGRWWPATA